MSPETVPALPGFAPERVARDKVAHPVPSVGVYMSPDHRYWLNGQGPVPSVTTILDIMAKPAVTVWKAKGAARAVINAYVTSTLPEDMDTEQLVNWAVREADKERDTAAALGSSVHRLADIVGADEKGTEGFIASGVEEPYLMAFRGFLAHYGGSQSIVSSEKAVWSANGYAGTYDLLMQLPTEEPGNCEEHGGLCAGYGHTDRFDTELWLIDIKTSKGYYPEYGLQLAGYRWADSIVLPDTPVVYPMPEIQRTGILHLRPDLYPDTGWRLIEYPTTYEEDYLTFLGALEIWKWRESKRFTKSNLQKRITP